MSIRLMSQVWEDARIQSQAELLVLLALADHARDDGLCWPSIRTIAAKARIEERSAQRILRRLIEKELVELVSKGGCIDGQNVPNRYKVKGGDFRSPHGLTESHPGATVGQGVGGDRQSPRGDPESTDGVTLGQGNHHIEPSLSKTTTTTTIYPHMDKKESGEGKAPESSSSRRFFEGEGLLGPLPKLSGDEGAEDVWSLVESLVQEFGLSPKQRQAVSKHFDSQGEDYVRSKAEIVRSQPLRNSAGALLAALRDDWQPPVATKGQIYGTNKRPVRPGSRNIGNSNEYCDFSQYKSRD
jgi:Helix-turn-helix domain